MRIGVDMYKVLYRIVFSLRRRLFDIWYPHVLQFFSPLILHLFPSNLGFFVGSDAINLDFKHHRLLPKLNYRLPYSKSMLDDFTVINVNAPIFSEVNVVFRGEVMIGEVNKEIPTLFLNPKDLTVVEGYKDVYLITADLGIFASFLGHKNGTPCYPCKREDHKVIFIRGNWFVKNEASIKNNLHNT